MERRKSAEKAGRHILRGGHDTRREQALFCLLPFLALGGINYCINQIHLLLCGTIQMVDSGDHRVSVYGGNPAGKFIYAYFGFRIVCNHMNGCGSSYKQSPLLIILLTYEWVVRMWECYTLCVCDLRLYQKNKGGVPVSRHPALVN